MTGEELLNELQKMTPEQRAFPVEVIFDITSKNSGEVGDIRVSQNVKGYRDCIELMP